MDKKFTILGVTYNLDQAANIGWDDPAVGADELDALEIGETLIDEDGDTWERIA